MIPCFNPDAASPHAQFAVERHWQPIATTLEQHGRVPFAKHQYIRLASEGIESLLFFSYQRSGFLRAEQCFVLGPAGSGEDTPLCKPVVAMVAWRSFDDTVKGVYS